MNGEGTLKYFRLRGHDEWNMDGEGTMIVKGLLREW